MLMKTFCLWLALVDEVEWIICSSTLHVGFFLTPEMLKIMHIFRAVSVGNICQYVYTCR